MEQEEKVLNPQESLRVIRETIEVAKKGVRESGFHFLLWGWLVVLACIGEYYLRVILGSAQFHYVWLVMVVIGMPAALVYEWRRRSKLGTERNVVRSWYGAVWMCFGVSVVLLIFDTASQHLSPIPSILALAGMATYISGALLQFKPLKAGAIALWAGAAACIFVAPEAHVLVQAGVMVAGYLVPGHMLNAQYRSADV